MRCGAARQRLYLLQRWDRERPKFPIPAEAAQAEAHLAHCEDCREFFSAEERLKNLLKRHVLHEKASASLRARLSSKIAREQTRVTRARRWYRMAQRRGLALAITVTLMVLALAAAFLLREHRDRHVSQQLVSALVEDHAKNLSSAVDIAAFDGRSIETWFRGKVDFTFHLPPALDQSLTGGRLCSFDGRKAALIFYERLQSRVSLFILDGGDIQLPEDRLIALDGRRCFIETRKGYNVVIWKERDLFYGLVSDIRGTDLLQFAAQF